MNGTTKVDLCHKPRRGNKGFRPMPRIRTQRIGRLIAADQLAPIAQRTFHLAQPQDRKGRPVAPSEPKDPASDQSCGMLPADACRKPGSARARRSALSRISRPVRVRENRFKAWYLDRHRPDTRVPFSARKCSIGKGVVRGQHDFDLGFAGSAKALPHNAFGDLSMVGLGLGHDTQTVVDRIGCFNASAGLPSASTLP